MSDIFDINEMSEEDIIHTSQQRLNQNGMLKKSQWKQNCGKL